MFSRVACLSLATILLCLPAVAQEPASMPAPKSTQVFGQKLSYYEAGEGPTVILIHGTGGSGEIWRHNLGPLSKTFHVYAPDQIGFGRSDKPLMDYKVATFVDFLQEFMRVLAVPRATIVGLSTGGWIAASFAIQHPDMVDKLVLADSTGLPPSPTATAKPPDFSYASLASTRALLERFFYNKKLVTDELVRRTFQSHMQTGDSYTIQRLLANRTTEYLSEDDLTSIHPPTLIVWGKEDSILPVATAERFHTAIQSSQVVVIEECGHATPIEKPAEFNKAVVEFLGGNR
jgi:2-hydroxy-6-oxonona-2,4-dienedioate hydrolase